MLVQVVVAGGVVGLTGELAAAQWGHRSRRHRCNAGGRQGNRCRLKLWVS